MNEEEYIKKILYDISLLNEKGTLMLLLDFYYIKNFFNILIKALGTQYKTKFFINFYFVDKNDFLFVITIQKMNISETYIDLNENKILFTDYFSNLYPKLICSKLIKEINPYLNKCFELMKAYYIHSKLNFFPVRSITSW